MVSCSHFLFYKLPCNVSLHTCMFCQVLDFFVFFLTVTVDVHVGRCVATSDFNRLENPNYLVMAPFDFVAY